MIEIVIKIDLLALFTHISCTSFFLHGIQALIYFCNQNQKITRHLVNAESTNAPNIPDCSTFFPRHSHLLPLSNTSLLPTHALPIPLASPPSTSALHSSGVQTRNSSLDRARKCTVELLKKLSAAHAEFEKLR